MARRYVRKVDILFCGLVRKPELFKKSIKDMILMHKNGLINKIILSTWKGEIQKNPPIHQFLKENDITIIESNEPKNGGHGNIWCQMKALDIGLKKINSNRFVLKTRSDVYINSDFLRKIFTSPFLFKINKSLPRGNLFKYKIWVHWYEITRPFYIADECFFGNCRDLKLLVNYDDSYDTKYNIGPGISHIRRYIHPFLRDYPILLTSLNKYNTSGGLKSIALKLKDKKIFDLRKISILRKLNEIKRFKVLKKRLKEEDYINCLAAYYSILYSHFYIDGDSFPNQVIFNEFSTPSINLDTKNIDNNFSRSKARQFYGGQIHAYNRELLKNICEKNLIKTNLSERLMGAIDKFNNLNGSK